MERKKTLSRMAWFIACCLERRVKGEPEFDAEELFQWIIQSTLPSFAYFATCMPAG
jgi:hypothetical protein